jgi:hypothetical protein
MFIDRHVDVNQISDNEAGRTHAPVENKINVYKVLLGNPEEKGHSEALGVDARILKYNLEK